MKTTFALSATAPARLLPGAPARYGKRRVRLLCGRPTAQRQDARLPAAEGVTTATGRTADAHNYLPLPRDPLARVSPGIRFRQPAAGV
jgi:hypothetical protein